MQNKIYNLELVDKGVAASFVLRTMEEIADRQKGIADDPHRHNYYSVIWPFGGSGRHVVDFNEYPTPFRRGVACYKIPQINNEGTMKNKWIMNPDLPIFAKRLLSACMTKGLVVPSGSSQVLS